MLVLVQYLSDGTAESGQETQADSTDFSKLLQEEVKALRSKKGNMFFWHNTNVTGLLYVRLTKEAGDTLSMPCWAFNSVI